MVNINTKEFQNLSQEEQNLVLQILSQYEKDGNSQIYNDIIYADYEEIPVDIITFLHDPHYLGNALINDEGKYSIFPYWEKFLKNVFPNNIDTNYNTAILSGGIGLGKSTIAVIGILYELYRMMCLKNPYKHYGLQEIDLISFAFINITLDAAKGVAWDKCQQLLQKSEWFMQRGTLSKSANPIWRPPKGIELITGSNTNHIIGRALFACLDGDTEIATANGDIKISQLIDKNIQVKSIDKNGNICLSDLCTIQATKKSIEEYQIELEDGTVIKCTPEHLFMLKDGTYKQAKYLTEDDELFDIITSYQDYINNIITKIKKISKINLNSPKQYYDVINANPYNNFLIKTNQGYICSHNCFIDEISFIPNKSVEQQIQKAKKIVNAANTRMQSRFMKGEKNPTILFLASSKRTEQSFLETFIAQKKQNESKSTIVVDEPQWIIRTDKDSPNKFKVAIGNKYLQSELLPLGTTEDQANEYIKKGFTVINVPMGYYENFRDDLEQSLMDIAGISVTSITRYISSSRLNDIVYDNFQNPFSQEILEIGNGKNDNDLYQNYFDINKVPKDLKEKPLYIHLDMSISGDKTGIGGVFIVGKKIKATQDQAISELEYQIAFAVSIKAPKGYQISFEKNRQFIYWLKEQGFNIKGISTDSYQSYDLGQILQSKGFNYSQISVDRCTNKINLPYQHFRNVIYEKRLRLFQTKLLYEEIIGLQRDNNTGAIDHDPLGVNSKDISDSICASIYNASQHADEFAFDYGETLDTIADVNDKSSNDIKQQITVDFQEELKKINNPLSKKYPNQEQYKDFGFGKAVDFDTDFMYDDIII